MAAVDLLQQVAVCRRLDADTEVGRGLVVVESMAAVRHAAFSYSIRLYRHNCCMTLSEMARHILHTEGFLPVEAWGRGVGREHHRAADSDTSCVGDHQGQRQRCACVDMQRERAQKLELEMKQE